MATDRTRTETGRGGPVVWGVIALALVIGIVLLVVTLFDWAGGEADPPPAQLGAGAGEVLENPDQYRDEVVTVSGEVNRVFGPLAYTIGGERFVNGEELLVIGPAPAVGEDLDEEELIAEQDIVQVNGTVHDYDLEMFEDELGAEIEAEIPEELQDQPVLLSQGTVVTQRVQPDLGFIVEVEDVVSEPEDHLDETVSVEGEITEAFNETAFILNDQLLVIDSTETLTGEALEEADRAQVSGNIMMFDIDQVEAESGVSLDAEQFEQFQDQPVMVALSILLLPETAD